MDNIPLHCEAVRCISLEKASLPVEYLQQNPLLLRTAMLPESSDTVYSAENLSQEILQGQGLIGQRTKCHPRGAIAMKTLTGVSPDVSEACCFPKSRNRTSLFCSAEYYFAVNFMFSPLSEVMMLLNFHLLFHWLCLPNAKCWKGLHKLIYPELANVCLGDMCSC